MPAKILKNDTYYGALDEIISLIKARKASLTDRHVLIVPDKYTLAAEKKLIEGSCGAFDAEVLTISRLFYKLGCAGEYLSREGAVMLLREILERTELECFSGSAQSSGFSEKLYDTLTALRNAGIGAEDIRPAGRSGSKMRDIGRLLEEYEKQLEGRFIDSSGRYRLLSNMLACTERFKNTTFYIANFHHFSASEQRVLDMLSKSSKQLIVSSPEPVRRINAPVEVYDCPGMVQALKAAAVRIRGTVSAGMRYRDICIAAPSANFSEAARILKEFDIPFYIDHKYELSQHQLSRFLLLSIDIAERNYRRADMIGLAKNIYMNIPDESVNEFENFCNEYYVDHTSFLREFREEDFEPENRSSESMKKKFQTAESVRARLADYLAVFVSEYRTIDTAGKLRKMFSGMLGSAQVREISGAAVNDILITPDIPGKIGGLLELMEKVLGEKEKNLKLLSAIFRNGLEASKYSVLPNLSDSVVIGEDSIFRGQKFEFVIALGAEDGVLPKVEFEGGLLRDEESEKLCGSSAELIKDKNRLHIKEFDQLLSAAQSRIFIAYDSAGERGESNYVRLLERDADIALLKNSYAEEQEQLLETDDDEAIADMIASRGNALEMLVRSYSDRKNYGETYPFYSSLKAALGAEIYDRYTGAGSRIKRIDNARSLYFPGGSTSVSQLQEYFACPYMHFMKFGLRAQEKKDGQLKPIDIGNILHEAVEIFVKESNFSVGIRGRVAGIIAGLFEKNPRYRQKVKDKAYDFLVEEAGRICEIFAGHLTGGKFESLGQEIKFGRAGDFGTIELGTRYSKIYMKGAIDMADRYGDYVRIIDYKTGKIKFDYGDIYYGRKLQLPLYMQVFIEYGYRPAGFFYFPFSLKWTDDEFSHRLEGVYDRSPEIISALDGNLSAPGDIPVKSKVIFAAVKDSTAGLVLTDRKNYALSSEALYGICSYAKAAAGHAADEILSGNIEASPYLKDKRRACGFCAFKQACGAEDIRERRIGKALPQDFLLSDSGEAAGNEME